MKSSLLSIPVKCLNWQPVEETTFHSQICLQSTTAGIKQRQRICYGASVWFHEILLFLILSAFFLALAIRYGENLDQRIIAFVENWRRRLFLPSPSEEALAAEITWIQFILGHLRAGVSLDQAMEASGQSMPGIKFIQEDLARIQAGEPPSSSTAMILQLALRYGGSIQDSLLTTKRGHQGSLKAMRKARSTTAQARAQTWVASLLPLLLLLAGSLSAPELWRESLAEAFGWGAMVAALILIFSGFRWSQAIQKKALIPLDAWLKEQEEHVAPFLTRVSAELSAGQDVSVAFSRAGKSLPENSLLNHYLTTEDAAKIPPAPALIQQLRSLKLRAERLGAPIRQELLEIAAELESQRDTRWEEVAQQLPLRLLLPIFLCIVPANFLFLLIPLLPSLRNF